MQFILAAILVVFGAAPACTWLLSSPYAHHVREFQDSAAIKAVLVNPEWLLAGAFLMACYGLASVLLCAGRALVPGTQYCVSSDSPFHSPRSRVLEGIRSPAPAPVQPSHGAVTRGD